MKEIKKKSINLCILDKDFATAFAKWEVCGSARWKKEWFKACDTILQTSKKLRRDFVIDYDMKIVARKVIEILDDAIQYDNGCANDGGKELVYFITMETLDGTPIYYKVGTTTRSIDERMREHLVYYNDEHIVRIKVLRVFDCGEIPAEGLESAIRAHFMKKYPRSFKKNDRFIANFELDLEHDVDEVAHIYLS